MNSIGQSVFELQSGNGNVDKWTKEGRNYTNFERTLATMVIYLPVKFVFNFIQWIKLFNKNITAYVTQCGFLSDPIPIERGCRQGDPIAPYLFLLVAEVLACLIQNSSDVTGIAVGKIMYKLAQFADDTTIILDGSVNSLQAALNILEIFGALSGLKINS